MIQLNERQLNILTLIREHGSASNLEIKKYIKKGFGNISRATIVRDTNKLLEYSLIEQKGKGRNIYYQELQRNEYLKYIDIEKYFKESSDKREVFFERFNFAIIKELKDIFSEQELKDLQEWNNDYKKRVKKLSATILKKEFERLTIELSWKSSQIEGNTYSLIDTEVLIKEHKEAKGHNKEEAIMILNHKKTFDYVLSKKDYFAKISISKIENLHRLLTYDLNVSQGLRKRPVGIIGTRYRPIDNEHQIKEAIEKVVKKINSLDNPFAKALSAILFISYIQPFEDGNKRTARILGNAILLAYNICPLSFRSIDESEYKKAVIVFYEQNNLRFFKELFINQFKFAVNNYFLA